MKIAESAHQGLAELATARMMNPQAVFIIADDGRTWTYAAFWNLAGQIAGGLLQSGAQRGDRVAVQVDKSVEALALFWACARAGLVFLPLNTAYTASEVSYFLEDASPAVFICTPDRLTALEPLAKELGVATIQSLDDCGGGSLISCLPHAAFADVPCQPDDLAAILYTSGTTGKSKGAMLSHGNLASNALALIETWAFTDKDRLIHALPVYHTHGLFVAMNTVFLSGGCMLFQRKFNADEVMKLLPQATTLMGVPTFYTRLLQHPGLDAATTAHMRLFVSGSAPLLAETHREFEARTGMRILERYGMTETNMNASNPYAGERRAGTVGMALPGITVRVVDRETGQPLPNQEDGMIEVKGPNVFLGYWQNPEKTAAEFTTDGYFITGDLGYFDRDGYLVISGRGKDLIITGGFNVYPKEVELLIDEMPGVLESAVIGLKHADFGEAVTAVVVAQAGAVLDVDAMGNALQRELAKFKVPKKIIVVAELPRNAMGKVQKNLLRQTYAGLYG